MKLKINPKRFILFILAVLTVYIGVLHYKSTMDYSNIKDEMNKYSAMLETEKQKNAELTKEKENLESDETYERIARDNLGLLKADELEFVDLITNLFHL